MRNRNSTRLVMSKAVLLAIYKAHKKQGNKTRAWALGDKRVRLDRYD